MANDSNELPDFYRLFVENVRLRLENRFSRIPLVQKYSFKKKSCRISCKRSAVTGNHTLCRIIDLTDNERGKLEWFSSDQRHERDKEIKKKFILIFYRDKIVKNHITSVEDTYKFDGVPKKPYNFACHYANLSLDTSRW